MMARRALFAWLAILVPAFTGLIGPAGPDEARAEATKAPSILSDSSSETDAAEAQYVLGLRYHEGRGVLPDYAQAARHFAAAAALGHAGAQNHLGRYHHEGLGVTRDSKRALELLESAAEAGDPQHLFDLATVLESIPAGAERAADLYRRAAAAGHPDAPVNLGAMYQNGTGVAQDFARAAELYRGPAERGHPRALNNLGALYVRGDGVPQDYARAAEFFSAAAEQGLPSALTNLGVLYENGFGVPLDSERAAALYREAARGAADSAIGDRLIYDRRLHPPETDQRAQDRLAAGLRSGDPVALFQAAWLLAEAPAASFDDQRRAADLFREAATRGHGPAMANLGILYFRGEGLPQDFELGQMWLLRAAAAGVEQAASLSEVFSARMTAAQINGAQKRAAATED